MQLQQEDTKKRTGSGEVVDHGKRDADGKNRSRVERSTQHKIFPEKAGYMAKVAKPSQKSTTFKALQAFPYDTEDESESESESESDPNQEIQGLDINSNCVLRESARRVATKSRAD